MRRLRTLPIIGVCGVIVLAFQTTTLHAQEIQWRFDYQAARAEAKAQGRFILLDIGTEHCFWCKKLDVGPFRDPAIVKLLSSRYMPIKIDAERSAPLAQALRVQSYPTLIIAAPDGLILNVLEGYLEPQALGRALEKAR